MTRPHDPPAADARYCAGDGRRTVVDLDAIDLARRDVVDVEVAASTMPSNPTRGAAGAYRRRRRRASTSMIGVAVQRWSPNAEHLPEEIDRLERVLPLDVGPGDEMTAGVVQSALVEHAQPPAPPRGR